jgi:hypothetical protein
MSRYLKFASIPEAQETECLICKRNIAKLAISEAISEAALEVGNRSGKILESARPGSFTFVYS